MSLSNRRFHVKGNALLKFDFTKKNQYHFHVPNISIRQPISKNKISCIFDFFTWNYNWCSCIWRFCISECAYLVVRLVKEPRRVGAEKAQKRLFLGNSTTGYFFFFFFYPLLYGAWLSSIMCKRPLFRRCPLQNTFV